jgi:predicted dehydrogenase
MKVAILGSGFGLYGYLPALCGPGCEVILPERYRMAVESRPDIAGFAPGIIWAASDEAALECADALVVSRRPEDQSDLMDRILSKPRLRRLLLEKPIARNPEDATQLQAQIEASGKILRVGYSFGATDWGQQLIAQAQSARATGDMSVRWTFRAHHYAMDRPTWKRSHSQGGGALRFYGIQVLALLAQMGFDRALASSTFSARPDEAETWHATIASGRGERCDIVVETQAASARFSVAGPGLAVATDLADPFGDQTAGAPDRRIAVLTSLCRDLLSSEHSPHQLYADTIALWRAVEAVNVHAGRAE